MRCFRNAIGLTILFLVVIIAWPVSAGEDKKASSDKPAEKIAEKIDPFAVPDAEPKKLADFIKKTAPSLRDADKREKARAAIIKAAEKILASKTKKATAAEMAIAVQAKMNMLQDGKQLAAFAEELKKDGREDLARLVRSFAMQLTLRQAAVAGPEKVKAAIGEAVKFIEATPPQSSDMGVALMAGQLAERSGDNDLAIKTYRALAKAFAASKDAQMAEFTKMLEGVVRRMELLGNPMKIEGKLLGGTAFDWSKYKGKVVLVGFWATWGGPCVAEIPNMKKYYKFYHDKGFDIVGISCDNNLADLENFVKEKKIPWPIVFGDGVPSPTVTYYGIITIPTMVLVGKDGKVVSLNARGDNLKKELAKLLGPMEEKKETKGAAAKKQENAPKAETAKRN